MSGLTAKKVEREKQPGRYSDGNGLYLEIRDGKRGLTKCFLFRYERDGRERWMGLGATHTVSLQRARVDAKAAREKLREGVDPIDARHEAHGKEREARQAKKRPPKVATFRHAAERYMAAQEGSWRSATHRGQWRATLATYAYPIIGDMPVADVDVEAVLQVLQPVWTSKQVTAVRLRGRIERTLNWAKALGLRTGENPAQWKGHLENLLQRPKREKEHHLALPYKEIPAFIAELRQHEGTVARALELCVLTASRSAEVLGARWDEVDFDTQVWTIDKSRMKPGKEHSVPLSDRAIEILEGLPREEGNQHVFVGAPGRPLGHASMWKLLRRLRPGFVPHGFRASFSTWASNETHHANHVIELSLAHAVGTEVERVYKRGTIMFDKRRELMQAWSRYCASPANQTGEVSEPRTDQSQRSPPQDCAGTSSSSGRAEVGVGSCTSDGQTQTR